MAGMLEPGGRSRGRCDRGSTPRRHARASAAGAGEDGKAIFGQLCQGCHTIGGGKLVGPDLKGVADLRERTWVESFILAPDKVIASGDPIAKGLVGRVRHADAEPGGDRRPDRAAARVPRLRSAGRLDDAHNADRDNAAQRRRETTPAAGDAGRGEDLSRATRASTPVGLLVSRATPSRAWGRSAEAGSVPT